MTGIREVLAARWPDAAAVEDVIGAYRRALDAHGAAIRSVVLHPYDGPGVIAYCDPMPKDFAEQRAWFEGRRALWMHMLDVVGPAYEAPPAWVAETLPLPPAFLTDLGLEAFFWTTNAAFVYPLELVFHAGRRAAFQDLCALANVDPYHLKRPRKE